jgi:hypothetical protein
LNLAVCTRRGSSSPETRVRGAFALRASPFHSANLDTSFRRDGYVLVKSTSPRPTQPAFATDSRSLASRTSNATTGGGFRFQQDGNRSNVSWDGASEAEVQRLSLALAVTAIMLGCGTVTRAQVVCQPLPPWYPRGWELMLRYPCVTYVYGSPYYASPYYSYPAVYPYQRVSTRAVHPVHRRPYLRPGWWW